MTRPSYPVHAHDWDGRYWVISAELPGRDLEPITQATKVRDIAMMATEAIAITLDVDEDSFDIDVSIEAPSQVDDLMTALEASVEAAKAARNEEAAMRRATAVAARDAGLTIRDAGELLGISYQRVAQLLKEHDRVSAA